MSYNKSDGSNRYNREERGGWYCTNPKRHEEEQQHHAADEPHVHHAERNDTDPQRQPQAKTVKQKHSIEKPVNPMPAPVEKKKSGCHVAIIIMFWTIMFPIIFAVIFSLFLDNDNNDQEEDYYEYYDEGINPEDSDSLIVDD